MHQTWLITGPPGCGKSNWIRDALLRHEGPCAYLRLNSSRMEGLDHGPIAGIDSAWLRDQIPELEDLSRQPSRALHAKNGLVLIEVQQFQQPKRSESQGLDPKVKQHLEQLNLRPDRTLHFGLDPELPSHDTLDFQRLEAWDQNLQGCVWDPNSLSSFWFELVNGAYGDVYRAKGLMNLPDGRSFFCNWMVSQEGSQFLPLDSVEPPKGRPERTSHLVVQGRALNCSGLQSTIDDCLLRDDVLELHQAQLRDRQHDLQPNR